jgi:hypothetical protein
MHMHRDADIATGNALLTLTTVEVSTPDAFRAALNTALGR